MADELDDLFGSEGEDDQQQETAFDEAALEDDMDMGPMQIEEEAGVRADVEQELFGELSDEDDAAAQQQEERGPPIDVHAPLLQRPPSDQVLLLKMPNILRIDPRPFDPATFEEGVEEYVDERGQIRVRPRDINVIRWRFRDGNVRESNARYIQWEDGTESIMLGDEILQLNRQNNAKAHTYLYAVRYDVIEGQAHLNQRATVAPASLQSKIHKRMKMTVSAATAKRDKVQLHYAAKNPELEKAEAEKRAEEAARLKAAQERVMARSAPRAPRRPAFTAAYLEEEDEDYGAAGGMLGAGDSDDELDRGQRRNMDEDQEAAAAARLQSAKRTTPPPGSSRKRGYEEAEEEEAVEAAEAAAADKAPGIKVRRGAILDDDDD